MRAEHRTVGVQCGPNSGLSEFSAGRTVDCLSLVRAEQWIVGV